MLPRAFTLIACCIVPLIATCAPGEGESHWIAPHEGMQKIGSTPCPMFRASFTLDAEPVSGSVKAVGLGHYELLLNGTRPGQALINQPWSEYNKTIYYQEFDISKLLKKGENVWGVLLGNSFWRVEKPTDTMRYVKTDAMPDFSEGRPYLIWLEAHVKMGRILMNALIRRAGTSPDSTTDHGSPRKSSRRRRGRYFPSLLPPLQRTRFSSP